MAKQSINVGTSPNDNRGDSLRISFQKINANFTELYTALGINADVTLNIGAFEFAGSVMSTTDSSAIVIDQATTITSNLSVGGDVLPTVANGGDLGSSARPWRSLYVSNNTIFLGGVSLSLDASNNLTVNGSRVGATSYADLTGKPSIPTSFSSLVNSTKTVSLASTGVLTLPNISTIDASVAQVGYSYGPYDIDIYYNTTGGALDSGHLTYIDIGVTAHNNLFNAPIAPRSTITGTIAANGNFTPGTPTVGTFTRFNLIRVGGVTIGSLEYRDDANPSAGLRIGLAGSTYTGPTVTSGTIIEGWSGRQTVAPKITTYIRWADGSSTQVTGSQVRYPGESYAGVVTTDNVSGKHFRATLYTANYSAATTAIGMNTKQWQFDGNGTLTFPNQTTFGRNNAGDYALASFNDLVLKSKKSVTISSGEDIGALETSYTNSLVPLTSLLTALTYMGPGYPASHTSYAALAEAQATNPLISDELVVLAKTTSDAWDAWQAALNASAVTIGIGDKGWHFDTNGNLTFPNNSVFDGQTLTDHATGVNYTLKIANGDGAGSVFGIGTGDATYGIANDALNHAEDGYVPYTVTAQNINLTVPGAGTWGFGSDGSLTLPNSAVIGQASDVEITAAATAYTDSLTAWASVRASYQAQANDLGLTSSNWPFIAWNVTGPTAAGLIAQLLTVWQIQQGAPTSPPTPLIFQPPISASAYYELRAALILVRDSYTTWQALLTSVEITAGGESITLLSNGKIQVPGIIQTDVEEDLVIRTRYAGVTSPPAGSGQLSYANKDFVFSTNGSITFPRYGGSTVLNATVQGDSSGNLNLTAGNYVSIESNSYAAVKIARNTANTSVDIGNTTSPVRAFGDLQMMSGRSMTTQSTTFNLINDTATTVNFAGAATTLNMGAAGGTTTIAGDLVVNGTTTTINSTTLTVDDKNIELGSVASPTDTTADGGGITLKGTTDKTIVWDNANTNWTASEHWNIASGKSYKINNVAVLTATAVLNDASQTSVTIAGSATTLSLGNTATAAQTVNMFTASTGASTYNFATGATASATTKAINIGTSGVSGSTTNIAIGSTVSGATSNLTFGGSVADATSSSTAKSVGYLGMPQQSKSTAYTTVIGDAGKHIYVTATATITIDSNANVAYPIGTTIAFIAAAGATVTIAITSDTMYLGGTGTTGSRTLAAYGMATAVKVTSTSWFINGAGLT
jgi:hypothetical protein